MNPDAKTQEQIVTWATASKLFVSTGLALSILRLQSPLASILLLIIYITADWVDGVWARAWQKDTNARRMVDAIVDKVSIHGAFWAVIVMRPELLPLYLPLMVRDALIGAGYLTLITNWKRLFVGSAVHRLSSITCGCLGVTILLDIRDLLIPVWIVTTAISYILLVDAVGVAIRCRLYMRSDTRSGLSRVQARNWEGIAYLIAHLPGFRGKVHGAEGR